MENYDPTQHGGYSGVTRIEEFDRNELPHQLAEKYHIFPFRPDYPGWAGSAEDINERRLEMEESDAALNDERATMRNYVYPSGRTNFDTKWFRTEAVIRTIESTWIEGVETTKA